MLFFKGDEAQNKFAFKNSAKNETKRNLRHDNGRGKGQTEKRRLTQNCSRTLKNFHIQKQGKNVFLYKKRTKLSILL